MPYCIQSLPIVLFVLCSEGFTTTFQSGWGSGLLMKHCRSWFFWFWGILLQISYCVIVLLHQNPVCSKLQLLDSWLPVWLQNPQVYRGVHGWLSNCNEPYTETWRSVCCSYQLWMTINLIWYSANDMLGTATCCLSQVAFNICQEQRILINPDSNKC